MSKSCKEFLAERQSGELNYDDYVMAILAGIEKCRNANVFISHDPERVLDQVDSSLKDKPLAGLPFAVKDNILTEDYPTSNGTRALASWNPGVDAAIVRKLRELGGVLLGKTNMPEFCQHMSCDNLVYGPVRNPFNKEMFVGGSSSGSAAGVAGGIFPFSVGSDTGGSVRIPAALAGCCGFRPSTGRYPTDGFVPVTPAADAPGLLARSVEDIQMIDGLLVDTETETGDRKISDLRIGIPRAYFFDDLDPDIQTVIDDALATLSANGAELVEESIADIADVVPRVGFPIAFYEMTRQLSFFFLQHPIPMTLSELVDSLEGPVERDTLHAQFGDMAVPYETYLEAIITHLPALRRLYEDYFSRNRLDVFITPTTPAPAKRFAGNGPDAVMTHNGRQVPTFPTYVRNTEPTSFAGVPAISIPAGLSDAGLPVGLEIVGKRGTDRGLLQCAKAVQSCLTGIPGVRNERSH